MVAQEAGDPLPLVEATRDVIEHFNRQNLKGFDAAGYFVHRGVIVCESGKSEQVKASMQSSHTMEPMELAKFQKEAKKS
jgi:hypothetical protein